MDRLAWMQGTFKEVQPTYSGWRALVQITFKWVQSAF